MSFESRLTPILKSVAGHTEVNDHTGARIELCTQLLETFSIDDTNALHMIRGNYKIVQRNQQQVGSLTHYYDALRRDTDRSLYKLLDMQFTKPVRKIIERYL